MPTQIVKIKLDNKNIIITNQNNEILEIPYTKENRLKVLTKLKENKNLLIKEKNKLQRLSLLLNLITLLNIIGEVLLFQTLNNLAFKILSFYLAFEITLTCFLLSIFSKDEIKNIMELLKIIKENKLPNEDILFNQKVVDIQKYKKVMNRNFSNYPSYQIIENDQNYGKCLPFKRK